MPSLRQAVQGLILFAFVSGLITVRTQSQATANAQSTQMSGARKGTAPLTPEEKEAQKHYRIAQEALKNNDLNTAADELKTAATLAPNNAVILYNLAVVESKKDDPKSALDHLHRATSLGLPENQQDNAAQLEAKLIYQLKRVGGETSVQQSQNDAPSYDDTVHYIQERLSRGLKEVSRCNFVWDQGKYERRFNVADFSPHVSWLGVNSASINCSNGAECVRTYNAFHQAITLDHWIWEIKDENDKSKMDKALLHLLVVCGVPPAKPDLF
jgi:tetratricopeptide (TPR) repeat protein